MKKLFSSFVLIILLLLSNFFYSNYAIALTGSSTLDFTRFLWNFGNEHQDDRFRIDYDIDRGEVVISSSIVRNFRDYYIQDEYGFSDYNYEIILGDEICSGRFNINELLNEFEGECRAEITIQEASMIDIDTMNLIIFIESEVIKKKIDELNLPKDTYEYYNFEKDRAEKLYRNDKDKPYKIKREGNLIYEDIDWDKAYATTKFSKSAGPVSGNGIFEMHFIVPEVKMNPSIYVAYDFGFTFDNTWMADVLSNEERYQKLEYNLEKGQLEFYFKSKFNINEYSAKELENYYIKVMEYEINVDYDLNITELLKYKGDVILYPDGNERGFQDVRILRSYLGERDFVYIETKDESILDINWKNRELDYKYSDRDNTITIRLYYPELSIENLKSYSFKSQKSTGNDTPLNIFYDDEKKVSYLEGEIYGVFKEGKYSFKYIVEDIYGKRIYDTDIKIKVKDEKTDFDAYAIIPEEKEQVKSKLEISIGDFISRAEEKYIVESELIAYLSQVQNALTGYAQDKETSIQSLVLQINMLIQEYLDSQG